MEIIADTKKSKDIPATKGMLEHTRDELKSDIAGVKLELRSVKTEVKALEHKMDSQFKELVAKIDSQSSKIDAQSAKIEAQNAKFERALALYEVQNARSRYVLDGSQSLHDLIDKNKAETDERLNRLENVVLFPKSKD